MATVVTTWTTSCDAALLRLMRYIKATVDWVLVGYVGDDPASLSLQLYADADFAGDRPSYKSTSGTLLSLHGPSTYVPLAGRTQKQGCVSHSTPEADIVSLDTGMRALAALRPARAAVAREDAKHVRSHANRICTQARAAEGWV